MEFILNKFENDQAILNGPTGEKIIWPKKYLPENIQIGEILTFSIYKKGEEQSETAKDILNEILKTK